MYFDDIIKILNDTNAKLTNSSLAKNSEYVVQWNDTNSNWDFFLATTTNGTTTVAGAKTGSMSDTDYQSLVFDTDYSMSGFRTTYYDLDATTHSAFVSATGKYVFHEKDFALLNSGDSFAYAMGDGSNAEYVEMTNDTTVDLAKGIKTADGSGGRPSKTNSALMSEFSGAASNLAVYTMAKYDSAETDPTSAFTEQAAIFSSISALPTPTVEIEMFGSASNGGGSVSTPNSGGVFDFDDANGTQFTNLDTAGKYLIVRAGADDYDAYEVTGSDPYTIGNTKIDLVGATDAMFTVNGSGVVTATTNANLTYVTTIQPPAANSGSPAYTGPSGSATIDAPDLSGKSIYSIDADAVGAAGDTGVATDGLYVILDNTGGGGTVDAYRVEGNAEQGWNVVEKVADAFASASTAEVAASNAGTLGDRIVELDGYQYDVYDLTNTTHKVASDGKYAVEKVDPGDATTWKAYAVTGSGTAESPYVLGSEDSAFDIASDTIGSSVGTVTQYLADDDSNLDGQTVALVADGTEFDAYEVTGGDGSPFALGDKVADGLFANASAVTSAITGGSKVVGYLEDAYGDTYSLNSTEFDVYNLTNSAHGVTADGKFVVVYNGSADDYSAYAVTGSGTADNPYVRSSTADTDTLTDTTFGNLSAAVGTVYETNNKLFEIERVAGERYGNIITYGVKLKDGMLGESVTFDSLTFNVKWEVNSGDPDYDFWGQFKPSADAPGLGSKPTGAATTPVTFFEDDDDGITFGMFADNGIKLDQGEYIATFMLDKVNTDTENTLFLNTAQYTLYDATDMDSIKSPETPQYGTQAVAGDDFDFSYAAHTVGLKLEMDNGGSSGAGQNLADVELLKTDVAVGEGLSLVPVAKNGNLIKYHVVMNVPIPVFIQHDADSTVDIDPDYKIEISGASIFDESVQWLHTLADTGSQTEKLVAGATLAGNTATKGSYTTHEFVDMIEAALNPYNTARDVSDLATSSTLILEAKDLSLPDVPSASAEGRYVLAEFYAISGSTTAITYDTSQGDTSGSGYGTATTHTITRIADADGSQAGASSYWTNSVGDGAEVTALAESLYENEQAYNDAIGAEDALGALKISRDMAGTAAENKYSQVEIIAADFNMDGQVSSADAYDILEFAVHGNGPGGPTAKFVFIDNITGNEATPGVVEYDDVIDKFVGDDMSINATAVLLGDVSSSYSGPPAASYTTEVDLKVNHLVALDGLGVLGMTEVIADQHGDAAGTTTGRDLVLIGNSGSYEITDYVSAVANSKMSGDVVAIEGSLPTLTFATAVTLTYNSGAATPETAPDETAVIAAADTPIDSSNNAVRILVDDTGSNPDIHYIAIDTSGDGNFTSADLLIEAGSLIHLVSNPLDMDTFVLADFSANLT